MTVAAYTHNPFHLLEPINNHSLNRTPRLIGLLCQMHLVSLSPMTINHSGITMEIQEASHTPRLEYGQYLSYVHLLRHRLLYIISKVVSRAVNLHGFNLNSRSKQF